MTPDDPRHGTPAGRHAHTRAGTPVCDPCRNAAARYEQELQLDRLHGRPRIVPSAGTRRRLQALVALGYDFTRIGNALGITGRAAGALTRKPNPITYATTAARVAALYDAWSMTLPAETTPRARKAATYARTVASRNGWVPPLAWDDIDDDPAPHTTRTRDWRLDTIPDPVAVDRRLAGDHTVPLNRADRLALVARARAAGWTFRQIEEIAGVTKPDRYTRPTHTRGDTAA